MVCGVERLARLIRDNSLSIAMFVLFAICIAGHSVASWRLHNTLLAAHGKPVIGYWRNVFSSAFLQQLASNWQAALLQLASLIVFSGIFYQRGASHSRDPDKRQSKRQERIENARFPWLYRHSLSVTFVLLFLLALALHIVSGAFAYNEQLALLHQPQVSIGAYLLSADFWSSTLETWQAEYLTIALFIVLSIFLRQQRSAESKPVESANEDTGKSNE